NCRDAVADELERAIRVVHVAGAMQAIEEHAELGDYAEQRVIAARAPVLGTEANRSTLGVAFGAEHGTVEIDGDPSESFCLNALEGHVTDEVGQARDFAGACLCESPRNGRHVRNLADAERSCDQWIVGVVVPVAQASKPEQYVDDQLQDNAHEPKYALAVNFGEAAPQPLPEAQTPKQRHEQYEARKRCQAVILEGDLWQGVDTADDFCFAGLHREFLHDLSASSAQTFAQTGLAGVLPVFLCKFRALSCNQGVESVPGFGGFPSLCERMLAGEHTRGPDRLLREPGGFPVVTIDPTRRRVGSSFDLRASSPRVRAEVQIGRRGGWDSE